MSRKNVMVSLTAVSLLITVLLLPITTNISTGYLADLPPWVEAWIKQHIIWFLIATIVFGLLVVILGAISAYMQFTDPCGPLPVSNELDDITKQVNMAADIANKDPMLIGYSNRFSMLRNWRQYAETLIRTYGNYKTRRDKESKYSTTQTVELLEKLVKHTKKSFIFLHRKNDFTEIARAAYDIAFEQGRWKYAADLAYDIGRVYHEMGRYKESNNWVGPLRTCLKNANFDGYWVRVYNEMGSDKPGILDEPSDTEAQNHFHEALSYAAKLYALEGLNKQNDNEAQKYFEKALARANKLHEKMLYSWIKIHLAKLAPLLGIQSVTNYYIDALEPFNTINLTTLEPPICSDIVNLKLVCYYQLGSLNVSDQSKDPNIEVAWYQKQLDLAKEYGSLDFQVLAHMGLAEIGLLKGLTQTSSLDQSKIFQNAYNHIKDAWDINRDLSDEEPEVEMLNKLAQLMINVVDELIKATHMNSSSLNPPF